MLRARAVEKFLSQVVNPLDRGITGAMLFNKDGMTLAKTGKPFANGNIYSALLTNIWESFEQQGVRDELSEMVISCESGVVIVMRVAEMLLAIVSDGTVPTGLLKLKLRGTHITSSKQMNQDCVWSNLFIQVHSSFLYNADERTERKDPGKRFTSYLQKKVFHILITIL
ncbi:roadblock/LC7 domain-containing protein [Ditylenchus destructor]|nr:roadblock/LC7 domain-containing protein [Ditylenchus destructor]